VFFDAFWVFLHPFSVFDRPNLGLKTPISGILFEFKRFFVTNRPILIAAGRAARCADPVVATRNSAFGFNRSGWHQRAA
jgi:hypothetical protein